MQRYHAAQQSIGARQDALRGKDEDALQTVPGMPHASDVVKEARVEGEIAALRAADRVVSDPARSEPPAEVFFLQGNALYRLGRYPDALRKWDDVVRLAPQFGPVYNNMADACFRLGRRDEARAHLRRAEDLGVRVNPEFKQKLGL